MSNLFQRAASLFACGANVSTPIIAPRCARYIKKIVDGNFKDGKVVDIIIHTALLHESPEYLVHYSLVAEMQIELCLDLLDNCVDEAFIKSGAYFKSIGDEKKAHEFAKACAYLDSVKAYYGKVKNQDR